MNVRTAESPTQFRYLAQLRLRDAQVLMGEKRWHAALYMSGYIVECSLKAALAKAAGGKLPPQYKTHSIDDLREGIDVTLSETVRHHLDCLPRWSHLLRYTCSQPKAHDVVKFFERVMEVHRCIQETV